jgi:hypothetical protein
MNTNQTELKRLARQLTIAQAGTTALVSGFSHDGKPLPGAAQTLARSLDYAIQAGETARQIREAARAVAPTRI